MGSSVPLHPSPERARGFCFGQLKREKQFNVERILVVLILILVYSGRWSDQDRDQEDQVPNFFFFGWLWSCFLFSLVVELFCFY